MLVSQLLSVEVKYDEEGKALLRLASLPASFDNLLTSVLFGKNIFYFEEVTTAH